jgi:hypothetical protein
VKTLKPKAIIVDIDGTVSCCKHRLDHFLGIPHAKIDWDAFEAGIPFDPPITEIIELVKAVANSSDHCNIVFVTGRNERTKQMTLDWLHKHVGLRVFEFYMRKENDRRHDYEVKKQLYEDHIQPYYDVRFVLEDRKQCVDMWRGLGLRCLQVAEGNY